MLVAVSVSESVSEVTLYTAAADVDNCSVVDGCTDTEAALAMAVVLLQVSVL